MFTLRLHLEDLNNRHIEPLSLSTIYPSTVKRNTANQKIFYSLYSYIE